MCAARQARENPSGSTLHRSDLEASNPPVTHRRCSCSESSPLPTAHHRQPGWTLHREGKAASCELRFVPLGSEVRMLRNGSLLMSRIFFSDAEALAWAEEERERMTREGSKRRL